MITADLRGKKALVTGSASGIWEMHRMISISWGTSSGQRNSNR